MLVICRDEKMGESKWFQVNICTGGLPAKTLLELFKIFMSK